MSRTPEQRLEGILDPIEKCREYQKLLTNPALIEVATDAVMRHIAIIGEATNKLPDSFTRVHPEIPGHQTVGMRNFLIHQYFDVEAEQVTAVIEDDLAPLETVIRKALGR